jgi:serine/threonine protein kinase
MYMKYIGFYPCFGVAQQGAYGRPQAAPETPVSAEQLQVTLRRVTAVPELYASGQKLGRYQLIRRLAVGGMAEIYLARVPGVGIEGFEKLVVLKRILPQHALDPELLRMFLDESRLSATLTHPHITEVYDVGTDGEAPFFAMEYVLGSNLRQLMQAHARAQKVPEVTVAGSGSEATPSPPTVPLPLPHAIGIVAAAAAGLHYAHSKQGPAGEPLHIVHRDVSPSNVLVSYDGAVKVSDFGIAKWAYQRTQTQEGALKGKFAYMSPEQCRGKALDARSDVFALGTILYELTTGMAPFRAPTDFEILNQIVGGAPEPPRWPATEREYPPALAAIVMRALAREPAERTPTAQALQVELEAFARSERLEVSTVALGAFMQSLFADDLESWRKAQRAGKSLSEHLADREVARVSPTVRTATDAFAATRRVAAQHNRRRALAVAALLGATVTGGVLAATKLRRAPDVVSRATAADDRAAPTPPARTLTVSTGAPVGNNVEDHPARLPHSQAPAKTAAASAARTSDRSAVRRRGRVRAATEPAATPSDQSRLHAWDPDSPVPP